MTLLMFLYALRKISLSVAAVGEETSGGDNQEAGHEDTAADEQFRRSVVFVGGDDPVHRGGRRGQRKDAQDA